MPPLNDAKQLRGKLGGKAYWRSLDQLADTAEFREALKREFPAIATEVIEPHSRRSFLKVMGASLALAGVTLAGCKLPTEKIAPFAYRQPGTSPGIPKQFATVMDLGGVATGLLVTSYDGRPIKVEGNPLHPGSLGAATAIQQASILDIYDPDRSRHPVNGSNSSWGKFEAFAADHFNALKVKGGAGLRILASSSSSPTRSRLQKRFLSAFPQAKWYEYEAVSNDNSRLGTDLLFGQALRAQHRFDQAKVIVSLDSDILGNHPNSLTNTRQFAKGRKGENFQMNQLFCVESSFSLTGANADERLAIKRSQIPGLAASLAAELFSKHNLPVPGGAENLVAALGKFSGQPAGHAMVVKIANALAQHMHRSVVVAGATQPPVVHSLAFLINRVLGNVGSTVYYTQEPDTYRTDHITAIGELVSELKNGKVDTLVILGANPVYNAPAGLGFATALGQASTSIHLSENLNETSKACTWHLNGAHFLEAWGDGRAYDGTYSIAQPLIEPLFAGRSELELLAMILGNFEADGHSLVQETFGTNMGPGWEAKWDQALHDGVLKGSAYSPVTRPPKYKVLATLLGTINRQDVGGMELTFNPDARLYDGRFATNGWLQETPEPLTKMAWDNAVLIGIKDAAASGIKHGDMVRLEAGGHSLELPAYVMPGQADGSLALSLGFGRNFGSRVADGVGFNTYVLRGPASADVATGVTISKTGKTYQIVSTQDHHLIDEVGFKERERRVHDLVREANLEDYKHHPEFAKHQVHHPPLNSLWPEPQYNDQKWGMTIDLSSCTGCSACIVACQAENNIPVVGRERVSEGREMSWIRLDRYFTGEPEDAKVVSQPVACHHCEMAPCEQVCPVAATVHTDEGLNDMVYNRCIGTRYCSNNCPYKVRRFNFFNYRKKMDKLEMLGQNPEVTVRSRGVMEKCSYCVQRIQAAKITAKKEGRAVRDGEITPACAQTCPAQAITFGDLNDKGSQVHQAAKSDRSYGMLAELNVKPRTLYLAKLRNPAGGHSTTGANGSQGGGSH